MFDPRAAALLLGVSLAIVLGVAVTAQEPAPQEQGESAAERSDPEKSEAPKIDSKEWLRQRQAAFAEYELQGQDAARPFMLEPDPVLKWSNAERGTNIGGVFLWTERGRPAMIACAFIFKDKVNHEFQSLSDREIIASRKGEEVHRFGPGVEWKPLAEAPAPAAKRTARLTQFRRQAERFRVQFGTKKWSPARLLNQPVYRSPESLTQSDIAVFQFVQGTDPECVLLLEAAEGKWQYALARETKWGLKVEIDGREVWSCEPQWSPKRDSGSPFVVLAE
jgi:hypothetical protein